MVKIMDIHNSSIESSGYLKKTKNNNIMRVLGATSLGVPKMIERYQKRKEASRYLNGTIFDYRKEKRRFTR